VSVDGCVDKSRCVWTNVCDVLKCYISVLLEGLGEVFGFVETFRRSYSRENFKIRVFEIPTAEEVSMFWVVTPCGLVGGGYQRLGETYVFTRCNSPEQHRQF
jgi:hypothetical protein